MARAILLIGNYPPPYGGVPSHLMYLAPHLARQGWDVHVLTPKYRDPPEQRVDGFTVYGLGPRHPALRLGHAAAHAAKAFQARDVVAASGPRELLRCLELYRRAAAIVAEHQVRVISAYHVLPSGLVGLWLARETGLPLVTTIFGEFYADPDRMRRQRAIIRDVIDRSARLLSCSLHCARSTKVLDLPRVGDVVYYGIDVNRFSPDRDGGAMRARLGIGTAPVALFVGRMEQEMGLPTLLRAIPGVLARRPEARVIIAGRPGAAQPAALAARDAYPGAVHVLSNVSDDELPLLYAAADVVVVPSANERACLGLAAAEGMASGKPVIVTRAGGGPEVAIDGETGLLVPPEDPDALAAAIASVLGDPDAGAAMGRQGRARALAVFDKDVTNRTMERMFEELAA